MTQTEISFWLLEGAFYRDPQGGLSLYMGPFSQARGDGGRVDLAWQSFFDDQPIEITSKMSKLKVSEDAFRQELRIWLAENAGENMGNLLHAQDFEDPLFSSFEDSFENIQKRIQNGLIQKALPVAFARVYRRPSRYQRALWVMSLLESSRTSYVYGLWDMDFGIMGASPEILFHKKGAWLETVAVAGTLPKSDIALRCPLLNDPKERVEHEYVVKDLEKQLRPLGKVTVGPTQVVEFPHLFHLVTKVEVATRGEAEVFGAQEWISILHPTSALGVFPRSAGYQWLSELPEQAGRGLFGAPIVYRLGNDESVAVVAIRGIQWNSEGTQVGSGGGIVKDSDILQEWRELRKKRQSVFQSLGM